MRPGRRHGSERASSPNPTALLHWLRRGGARFSKLLIDHRPSGERGVFARSPIAAGKVILRVPRSHILTRELALTSDIGRAIRASRIRPENEDSYLAAYLLQEKHAPRSFWKPYLDSLPPSFPTVPLFFDEHELSFLKGSFLLDSTETRRASLLAEHALLRDNVPAFARFSPSDFIWARLVVITRNFGIKIDGAETRCLVPMADMMNHKRPPDTEWSYAEDAGAFTMTATTSMPAGAEVHDSYGAKCNSRFLLNYGFTLADNDADNEIILHLGVPNDTPWADAKRRILRLDSPSARKSFKVPLRHNHDMTREMLSFLRVACAGDGELGPLSSAPGFRVDQVGPVSTRNEERVLSALRAACEAALAAFESTAEEDDQLLEAPELHRNVRNAIVMRRGEKRVLKGYVDLVSTSLPFLQMPWSALEQLAASPDPGWGRFDGFIKNAVVGAVRDDPWTALDRVARLGHRFDEVPSHRPRHSGPSL